MSEKRFIVFTEEHLRALAITHSDDLTLGLDELAADFKGFRPVDTPANVSTPAKEGDLVEYGPYKCLAAGMHYVSYGNRTQPFMSDERQRAAWEYTRSEEFLQYLERLRTAEPDPMARARHLLVYGIAMGLAMRREVGAIDLVEGPGAFRKNVGRRKYPRRP